LEFETRTASPLSFVEQVFEISHVKNSSLSSIDLDILSSASPPPSTIDSTQSPSYDSSSTLHFGLPQIDHPDHLYYYHLRPFHQIPNRLDEVLEPDQFWFLLDVGFLSPYNMPICFCLYSSDEFAGTSGERNKHRFSLDNDGDIVLNGSRYDPDLEESDDQFPANTDL